ncbi:hypothetical protein L596_010817 [Steinernema carpocapsae]|uniref:C-type lectin domain-containing protein n=1 Tax=Steinernema carpocapsae TaxID=34508 RepID=A0A4U5PJH1_STECR|nr:hypothetical protein L596_010817 [Steinernema carpocapsae]
MISLMSYINENFAPTTLGYWFESQSDIFLWIDGLPIAFTKWASTDLNFLNVENLIFYVLRLTDLVQLKLRRSSVWLCL